MIDAAPERALRLFGHDLRHALRLTQLPMVLACYADSHARAHVLNFEMDLFPAETQVLIRFLVLNEAVPPALLEPSLGVDIVDRFQRLGLAAVGPDGIAMNGIRLVEHHGCLLMCDARSATADRYYGADSAALGRMVLAIGTGSVLDLCCGVGAQTILAGRLSGRAIGVDLNSRVYDLFLLNSAINNVDRCVSIRIGDMESAVLPGERFRTVLCNPPLVPVPSQLPFPVVGNGGESGLDLTCRVVDALPNILADKGVALLVGMCLGHAGAPWLDLITERESARSLSMSFIVPAVFALDDPAFVTAVAKTVAGFAGGSQTIWTKRVVEAYSATTATHAYLYYLRAQPAQTRSVQITGHWVRGGQSWKL